MGCVEPPRVAASQSMKALRAAACTAPSKLTTTQPDGVLGQGADHGGRCGHGTGPATVTTASTATTPSPSASTITGFASASTT